ncbi:MAG: winged helix-turn-helix domain-containing protein [Pyrinomonadaceae bacterium]
METLQGARFRFGNFELDPSQRVLYRDGEPVTLKPKAFDLLQYLVENHGKVLTKRELMEHIWPNQFVEDNNLTVQMSSLRKIFGDEKIGPIKTIPGKGYKFVAEVFDLPNDTELIIEQRSISRMVIEEREPISVNGPPKHVFLKVNGSRVSAILAISIPLILAVSGYVYLQSRNTPDIGDYRLSKLTSSGDITSATITPDGNYAVFARKESGGESLWLRQIETGSQQMVLDVRPVRFVGLAVSPNNSLIYATTFSPTLPDPQIWRIPLLGGVVEALGNVTTGAAISFSPDGTKIAYTESRSSMRETQLLISNTDGSEKRVVTRAADDERSFPNFNANPVAWSPDGAVIAAAIGERTDGVKHGILLVDPQSGTERFATERRWDVIDDLTWIDNENLAFIGYTLVPWLGQVWSVSRSTGEVRQITNDLNNYSRLASAQGGLLTVQLSPVSRVSIVDVAEKSGRTFTREILRESGLMDNVAFASDGAIVYSSTAGGNREIWRMSADGTDARPLTANANITFGMSISSIDGSVVFCSSEDGKHVLKIANSDGSDIRQLTDGPDDVNPQVSPDGRTVVFQKGLYNKTVTLWKFDLVDGLQTQLTETFGAKPALSLDGSKVAYYFMDQEKSGIWTIGLVSALDGAPVGKLDFPKSVAERRMRWHPGGRAIAQIYNEGDAINLLSIPLNGTRATSLKDLAKGDVQWFDFSADGGRIVIAHSEERRDLVQLTKYEANAGEASAP